MYINGEVIVLGDTEYKPLPEKAPELLECPCCGGKAVYKTLHAMWVECTSCGLSTPAYTDADVLAKMWNGSILAVRTNKIDENGSTIVSLNADRETKPKDKRFEGLLDCSPEAIAEASAKVRKQEAAAKKRSKKYYKEHHKKKRQFDKNNFTYIGAPRGNAAPRPENTEKAEENSTT